MNNMKIELESPRQFDIRRLYRMNKNLRIEMINWFNKELKMKSGKHDIVPERIWFDINRDEIIKSLETDKLYDVYIISKRGHIKVLRNKKFMKVMALRFRYYKKYMVIAEVFVSQNEPGQPAAAATIEVQPE